jgi:hypothetical protein
VWDNSNAIFFDDIILNQERQKERWISIDFWAIDTVSH